KKDYVACEQEAQKLIDRSALTEKERGWFMQLAASYVYARDKSKALSLQKRAYELNSSLAIPPEGAQYHRMADRSETQSRSALRFFADFENANSYMIYVNGVCDRLAFGVEADAFERALNEAAAILGVSSSRPEKEIGVGPDVLWLGDGGFFFVIEAKSEVEEDRKELYKSETGQRLHTLAGFKQR